jgi:hypothetical protein
MSAIPMHRTRTRHQYIRCMWPTGVTVRIGSDRVSVDEPRRLSLSQTQIHEAYVAAVPFQGRTPAEDGR